MSRKLHTRISPASVLAMVALFVALSGISYAAATISGADIVNNTVSGKDVKNRSLTGKDLSAKTVKSLRGKQGPQGAAGPQGVAGPQGSAGTALAYAQKGSTVNFVADRTKGFADISRPSTGLYCLAPDADVLAQAFAAGEPTRPIVASVEYGNTSTQTDTLIVQVRGINNECPENTFEVRTYRNGALANDVAFTTIVP